MDHTEIKAALRSRGYSLAAACEAMNRSYVQFYNVTTRKAKSAYVAQAIALLLDLPIKEVFPEMDGNSTSLKIIKNASLIASAKAKLVEAGLPVERKSS